MVNHTANKRFYQRKPFKFMVFAVVSIPIGFFIWQRYTALSPEQGDLYAQYTLQKILANETATKYFYNLTLDEIYSLPDDKRQSIALETRNASLVTEWESDTGTSYNLDFDIVTGLEQYPAEGHVESKFTPLKSNKRRAIMEKYEIDNEELETLAVSIFLDLDIKIEIKEDENGTTTNKTYTRYTIAEDQLVLFSIEEQAWEEL